MQSGTLSRVLLAGTFAFMVHASASAQSLPIEVPKAFPFNIGYFFECAFLQSKNPDLELPLQCVATEDVTYQGQPATIIAVTWGEVFDIDTTSYKGYAFFVGKRDGTFERMDGLRDISSWPGQPGRLSRYTFFTRTTGASQFWRNNLGAERVFDSELSVVRCRPCVTSRLLHPYRGSVSQCAGEAPTGEVREDKDVLPLVEAIDLARQALQNRRPPVLMNMLPFPSVYSQTEKIGLPSTFVTHNQSSNGRYYWAMTYRSDQEAFLIRVFNDREVEIEAAAGGYGWSVETVR